MPRKEDANAGSSQPSNPGNQSPKASFTSIPDAVMKHVAADLLPVEELINTRQTSRRNAALFSRSLGSRLARFNIHPELLADIPVASYDRIVYRLEQLQRNAPEMYNKLYDNYLHLGIPCPAFFALTINVEEYADSVPDYLAFYAAGFNNVELVRYLCSPARGRRQVVDNSLATMALPSGNLKFIQWLDNHFPPIKRHFSYHDFTNNPEVMAWYIANYLAPDSTPRLDNNILLDILINFPKSYPVIRQFVAENPRYPYNYAVQGNQISSGSDISFAELDGVYNLISHEERVYREWFANGNSLDSNLLTIVFQSSREILNDFLSIATTEDNPLRFKLPFEYLDPWDIMFLAIKKGVSSDNLKILYQRFQLQMIIENTFVGELDPQRQQVIAEYQEGILFNDKLMYERWDKSYGNLDEIKADIETFDLELDAGFVLRFIQMKRYDIAALLIKSFNIEVDRNSIINMMKYMPEKNEAPTPDEVNFHARVVDRFLASAGVNVVNNPGPNV